MLDLFSFFSGDANVTAGEILFTVTDVPFIGEFEADFDVCKLVDCPLASGEFELGTKQELPAITPAVRVSSPVLERGVTSVARGPDFGFKGH